MQAVNDLCNQMGNLNMQSPFIKKVNGHDDDIHALVKLAPTQFVSGSKDTKVKIWDFALQRQTECHSQHRKKGYESWVTAVAVVQDDLFVSATRDGFIDLWDFQGKSIGSLTYNPVVNTVSKNRNKMRIHCIAKNSFGTPGTFFTGASGCFQLWNSKEAVKTWTAHANDWVYCIEPLTEQRLITVIGSSIEVWNSIFEENVERSALLTEERKEKQRPHISAITRLTNAPHTMPCALFDGSVRIVDIDRATVLKTYQEHKNRVWSVVELEPHVVATGADDRCLKLWDIRQNKSAGTISKNPGRVSTLLKLDDIQLLSGSCPDDVRNSKEKGTLSFWDIRKLPNKFKG